MAQMHPCCSTLSSADHIVARCETGEISPAIALMELLMPDAEATRQR